MISLLSVRRLVLRFAAVVAVALPAGSAFAGPARAADPGTPPVGAMTMNPPTGSPSTEFLLAPTGGNPDNPAAAYCPGNSATDGYRWQTYVVPVAVDPATLTYDGDGPHPPAAQEDQQPYVFNLMSTGGSPYQNLNTSVNPSGLIDPSGSPMSFGIFPHSVFPAGDYYVGIACSKSGVTETHWSSRITLTPEGEVGYSYAPAATGAVPGAPTAGTVEVGDGQLTVSFTLDTPADPPVTRFDVTATPTGGGSPVVLAASSPATITGLTNGTEYSITITATNPVGTSAPSNAVTGVPRAVDTSSSSSSSTTTTTTNPTTSTTDQTTSTTTGSTVAPPSGSSTTVASSGGTLPRTGGSTGTIVLWAVLLLVLGRVIVLLVRRPNVLPPK